MSPVKRYVKQYERVHPQNRIRVMTARSRHIFLAACMDRAVLPNRAFRLFAFLVSIARADGEIEAPAALLRQQLGISKKAYYHALGQLTKEGFVEVQKNTSHKRAGPTKLHIPNFAAPVKFEETISKQQRRERW